MHAKRPVGYPFARGRTRSTKHDTQMSDLAAHLKTTHVPKQPKATDFCKPHIMDTIYSAARKIIDERNAGSFANFSDPLRIDPLVHHQTAFEHDSALVVLGLTYRETTILVTVKVVLQKLTGSLTLMCNLKGGWTPFEDWAKTVKSPSDPMLLGKKGVHAQQQWWAKIGKTFDVMRLPAELRNLVCEQAIGAEHFPQSDPVIYQSTPFWYCGDGPRNMLNDEPGHIATKSRIGRPNINLMFSCKQVYLEMKSHARNGTTKIFEDLAGLLHYIDHRAYFAVGGTDNLRHITLDFDDDDHIKFFDVKNHPSPEPNATLLRQLSKLNSIRIHLRSVIPPNFSHEKCVSPWRHRAPTQGVPQLDESVKNARRIDGFHTPCLERVPDNIIWKAKPHIEHIPRIILTGGMKESTKKKWHHIFSGQPISESKAVSEGWQMFPYYLLSDPQRCNCFIPCAFEPYYGIVRRRTTLAPPPRGGLKPSMLPTTSSTMKERC